MAAHLTKFFKIFDCGRFDNTHRVSGGAQRAGREGTGLEGSGFFGICSLVWALTSLMQIEAN